MRKNWSVFYGVLAFAQAEGAREHLHPRLTARTVSLLRLAVMPAHVEIAKSGVKGNERMVKESEAVAATIDLILGKALSARGFAVLDDPVHAPEASEPSRATDERRATIARLQASFDTLAPQVLSKPGDVRNGRYSLGAHVASMAAETADAIVFVRGAGVVTTTGSGTLTGFDFNSVLYCDVVVVDARTGDVLFASSVEATPLSHDMTVAAADLEKPLGRSFEKLRVGK